MASPLLTEGQSDPARVQLALSQVGYAGLTNLSFDYFPTAKHWVFWDDPNGFHASLEKFLNRIEGAMAKGAVAPVPPEPLRVGKKARPLAKGPR
jgi:hypothetical protein